MKKYWAFLIFSLLAGRHSYAQIDTTNFFRDTLPNGLQIVVHFDTAAVNVGLNLAFHAGSKYDRADQAGVAYLCHRLFESELAAPRYTRTDGNTTNYVTGGMVSSLLDQEQSIYSQEFLPSELRQALSVEARRLDPQNYSNEKINYWRAVLIEEEQSRPPESRGAFVRLQILKRMLPTSYAQPVKGYADLVGATSNDEIREFINRYYAANRAVLALSGNVHPDSVLNIATNFFSFWPSNGDTIAPIAFSIDSSNLNTLDTLNYGTEGIPFLVSAFPLPHRDSSQFFEALAINDFLFRGDSAHLRQELMVKRQLVAFCGHDFQEFAAGSIASFFMIPKPGIDLDTLSKSLKGAIEYLAKDSTAISDYRFEAWKNNFENINNQENRTTSHITKTLLRQAICCTNLPDLANDRNILNLPKEKLKKEILKFFDPRKMIMLHFLEMNKE